MKSKMFFLIILALCLMNLVSYAQFKDYGFKLGLQGHYVLPANEYTEEKFNPSLLFRGHGEFELSPLIDLGIGLGYGFMRGEDYSGDEYKTTFIPLDVRIILSPFDLKSVNPYIYLGGGLSYWDLANPPANPSSPASNDNGVTGLGVAGLGIEIALSEKVLLDITAGLNTFTSDEVNGEVSNLEDNFQHDVDRYGNIGIGLTYVFESCASDEDMDMLGKCDEQKAGTDPKNPDSDGDGLKDGEEVHGVNLDLRIAGLSPLAKLVKPQALNADTDGDGLKDGEEVTAFRTDPLVPDTDGDGLRDGEEVTQYKTDPLNPDTDSDGLKDGEEISSYQCDPTKPDTDGDTLNDGMEVTTTKTNPANADSDNDGANDGEEVNGINLDIRVVGKNVVSELVKTDPLNPDTDGDGLKDGEELKRYFTDPHNKDTDAGSVEDGAEVQRKTDPLDAFDDKVTDTGIKLDIKFKQGKAVIQTNYLDDLQKAFAYLKDKPDRKFEIHGYTSTEGSEQSNQRLSEQRANAVVNWFRQSGIDPERMQAIGHGECCPILVDGKEDREASRRIMLVLK